MQVCLLSLVALLKLGFSFNSSTNGLNIMYGGNVFGHATLKLGSSAFVSYNDSFSDFVKWHARLGHIGQDRMNRLAKEGLLD